MAAGSQAPPPPPSSYLCPRQRAPHYSELRSSTSPPPRAPPSRLLNLEPLLLHRAQICAQEGEPRVAPSSDLRPRGRAPRHSQLRSAPGTSPPPKAPPLWLLDPEPLLLHLRRDPHKVGDKTTSSVKNQNIRKPGQVN